MLTDREKIYDLYLKHVDFRDRTRDGTAERDRAQAVVEAVGEVLRATTPTGEPNNGQAAA